ncbi:MAG: hypothetical protein RLZ58_1007 [Pseudomonadota bacterium]
MAAAGVGLFGLACARVSLASGPAQRTLLVLGDSLSAEYGLTRGRGWVALLEQRLAREKIAARVVNASISGETTSGGRSRLGALLAQHKPTHLILELGGNDALRGLPLSLTEDNLASMTRDAKAAGSRVLLVGMQVPPNYGAQYTRDFAAVVPRVAKAQGASVVPFFLKGFADQPDAQRWFQADRIHPNEDAQPRMLDNVWPELRKLL